MSDIKLFNVAGDVATEITTTTVKFERMLQNLFEANMEAMLGARFIKREQPTDEGRIDSLGLGLNGCPVIVEYKRSRDENVVNQGKSYRKWLLKNKAEFKWLVMERFDKKAADNIDWKSVRLVLVAADFTKFDKAEIGDDPNIEFVCYKRFGNDLIALEWLSGETVQVKVKDVVITDPKIDPDEEISPFRESYANMSTDLRSLYEALRTSILNLGKDVTEKERTEYMAFGRINLFAYVVILKSELQVWLKVNPNDVKVEPGFSVDVRKNKNVGAWTIKLTIKSKADVQKAHPLLSLSYKQNS